MKKIIEKVKKVKVCLAKNYIDTLIISGILCIMIPTFYVDCLKGFYLMGIILMLLGTLFLLCGKK